MILLISITTLIFIFSSFVTYPPEVLTNPMLNYVLMQVNFMYNNLLLFIALFILGVLFLVKSQKSQRHFKTPKKIYLSSVKLLQISILGFFLAYILLFFIAFVQLNFFSLLVNINPNIVGVISDDKKINDMLRKNNLPPEIITSDGDQNNELFAIVSATTGQENFYGRYVLKSVPGLFVIPVSLSSGVYLIDNTLIINKINNSNLDVISPTVGYLFLKQYFWGRKINSYPDVKIMSKNEFISFRVQDSGKKLALADSDIKKIDDSISSVSAAIVQDTESLSISQNALKQDYSKRDSEYSKCLSAGYYKGNVFFRTNNKDSCKGILDKWESAINQDIKNNEELGKKIQDNRDKLSAYKYYDSFFKSQKQLLSVQKTSIPYEFGNFEPTRSIKILINSEGSNASLDYLETLVHEYLHYASYVPGKNFQTSFFEEGLTEYFARNIIRDELHKDTNIGYPVQAKIISEITKTIPEARLADIYFAKDEIKLEEALDQTYGDNFYKNNAVIFETLQYSSSPEQTLKLANNIMKLIGGDALKRSDLYNTVN